MGQSVSVQNALGFGGTRQHANQDVGLSKNHVEGFGPGIGGDAINRLHRAAPAGYGKAKLGQGGGDRRTKCTQPHHPDPAFRNTCDIVLGPVGLGLLTGINIEIAHEMQCGIQMILHHLIGHTGIFKANDWHFCRKAGR